MTFDPLKVGQTKRSLWTLRSNGGQFHVTNFKHPSKHSDQVWLKSNVIMWLLDNMWLLEPWRRRRRRRKKETGAIQDLSVTKSRPGKKETGAIQYLSVTMSRPGKYSDDTQSIGAVRS